MDHNTFSELLSRNIDIIKRIALIERAIVELTNEREELEREFNENRQQTNAFLDNALDKK
jgi:hypothetical protein